MESNIQDQPQMTPPQGTNYSVSQPKQKSGGSKWLVIFIILLVLGGAGIFFFTKSASEPIATPTPSFNVTPIDEDTETPSPAPTKSPAPVKKDEVSIEIQNGTGITGEAKLLSDKLKTLGYSDITAGNADSTDNTETTVTFLKTLSQAVQDEIKKELESFYKTVNVKTSSTQKSDIVIVTGLRSSQTSKPATSGTPKASGSATPKASSSATPKASTTPTPTAN